MEDKKKCCICKVEKDKSEFNKKSTVKCTLQPHCRECSKIRSKLYYANNHEKHIREVGKRNKRVRGLSQLFIFKYFLSHPCVDCGEKDPLVLEFDHVRGVKSCNVNDLIRGYAKKETLEKEIAKCDVRCANCHRRRTNTLNGSFRYRFKAKKEE